MKFENVKVRIATQVLSVGQPEKWHTIETKVILEEGDSFDDTLNFAFKKVNQGHEEYSQSTVYEFYNDKKKAGDIFFNVSKNKEERI